MNTMRSFKCAVWGLILVLIAGCASSSSNFVSPEVFSLTRAVKAKARQIRTGDDLQLLVEVSGKREVPMTDVEVAYDGTIPAPLVGDVNVASLTLTQARTLLERRYSQIYVARPLITLRMADDTVGEWGFVTVLGQVRSPGRFPIISLEGINLSDALREAGGFAPSANMNEIIVSRTTEDGKLIQCNVDITQLGRVASDQRDLVLYNGDVVHVPERLF